MAFFDRFRPPFFGHKTSPLPPDNPAPALPSSGTDVLSLAEQTGWPSVASPVVMPADSTLPAWLTDEESLRDEGILYGLSMARPDDKLAVIRACFEQTTVGLVQQIDDYNVQIGAFNLLIDQQESRMQEARFRLDALWNQPMAESQLVRTLVGLALAVVMGVGNFYLIDTLLQPAFPDNRWIALGVFLAGLAGGAGRSAERASVLRRMLETGGLPVSAGLFVLAESVRFQPLVPALAGFGFVLTLFLLAGKWLPGYLTRLHADWVAIGQNRQRRRDQRTKPADYEQEIRMCEQEISTLRMRKWQLQPALSRAEAALRQQHAHRDRLLKLFESEFQLARSQRDYLSEADRMTILRGN